MNLFDNIIKSSVGNFLGTQSPSVPSFTTPQAPRTMNYTAPVTQPVAPKPTMTLFSDEQEMYKKMKADNLPDETAFSMLKKRRMDILGGNDISKEETDILKRMQADNVPVKQAVSMIQQRRKDQFNKKYEEGNLLQKGAYNTLAFAAGNLETLAKYSGNALDFITGGTMGFGDEVKKMEQVTQSPEFDSAAFTAGTYLPDVAMAVSPIGGGYLAGAKGMTGLQGAKLFSTQGAKNLSQGLMGRSAVVGAGFGVTQPILDKGSDATMGDIATGAGVGAVAGAVSAPVIGKALKYGQAGYYGGLTGVGKSIARDTKAGVQAITPSGANISTRANRFNANEIREFQKMTGQSPGEFATSRGMTKTGDDAVVEAINLWQKSKEQADEALTAIKGRFKPQGEKDYLKMTIDDLDDRLTRVESPDSNRLKQLKAKYEEGGLTMSEINEVKRLYSQNYKYSFVDVGSESALRSRNLQDGLRNWQFKVAEENGLTNLAEINKTTQGWKKFADSLSKKIQGSSANNAVSLTDWVALSGGSPENIALYLGKKLASSEKVKQGAIKLFSKQTKPSIIKASIGDIQKSNFKKDVNRGVSGVGDNSGGKSLVRPVGLLPAASGKATGAKNFRVNQPKEKAPLESTKKAIIRDPRIKAQDDYLELKSLEESLTKGDEYAKAQARKAFNRKIEQVKVNMDNAIYEQVMSREAKKMMKEYGGSVYPEGMQTVFNKLKGYTRNKGNFNDIEGESGNSVLKKQFSDYTNEYNDRMGTDYTVNEMWDIFDSKWRNEPLKEIKKPLIKSNESKVIKPTSNDTIPEGYFKNAFGEIVKKPGYKKGGFVKIGSEPKPIVKRSADVESGLIEEARKYKSAEEFIKNNSLKGNRITNNDNAYQKGGYDGVVHILEDADSVNLTLIELKEKGTGKGTEIVKNLKQYADAKDKKLKIINSSNDKYWDSFKFLEKGSDGRYVYKPNTKPFTVEGRRGLDYKTPKEMIGKVVSYEGKNYEITNFIYSDESGTLYFRIKGDSGNKIVTPDKLGDKIEGYIPNKEEVIIQNIKPKKIYGKKISKEDELHLFKKNTRK